MLQHSNKSSELTDHSVFLLNWVSETRSSFTQLDPSQRIDRMLVEIQKRSLSEQVLILSTHLKSEELKIIRVVPDEASALTSQLQKLILNQLVQKQKTLLLGDLSEEPFIADRLEKVGCTSIFAYPLIISDDILDALVVYNYSAIGDANRMNDFFTFIATALSLSLETHRLSIELEQKDRELDTWSKHVETRIEEGTKNLLEKEIQYQTLFEGANDGILVHTHEGRLIEVNSALCRLLGYEKRALLQIGISDLTTSKAYEQLLAFFQDILNNETIKPLEIKLLRDNGTPFLAELNSRRIHLGGQIVIQTVIRDISEQRLLEEKLRESKEMYQILVEASHVGVFIIQKGMIQFVNGMFEQYTNKSKDDLLGRNFFDQVHPDDRVMVASREMQREKGQDVPDHYETRFLSSGKDWFWGEVRASRIIMDGIPSVLGNVFDITQRKQLELKLLDNQKMESIGTLAGGIAHDFNNLLGGILGYASLLLSDIPKDSPYYEDIHTIAETAKRAADLTNRLLAFARGGKYQVSTVDVNHIGGDVISILSHSIDKFIAIETHFAKKLWPIRGDAQQIHQVLMNICLNAVEAMIGGGRLTIATANVILDEAFAQTELQLKAGDYIRIIITDTGSGMDEKSLKRAFEPFYTTKSGQGGKGLGLSVVYGVVKNHEGTAIIDSEMGAGTRVTVYLPRFIKEASDEGKKQPASAKQDTILIVEDEEVIRQVAKRMLEKGNFKVLLAERGEAAIEQFKANRDNVKLVLLDLILPGISGQETARRLRKIAADVPIVFVSGYGPEDRPDLIPAGEKYFIQKPFQTELLLKTIQDIIQKTGK